MQLFVIACFTRLKGLRLDLCILFCGQHDLCFCHKKEALVISINFHQEIHIANISGILMHLQFIADQTQLPKLLLTVDSLTVSF